MRETTLLAVGVLTIVAAFATSARADDPPGLALAKQIVDEVRGDEHKAKMRIVWPETVETTPPEGAEVVLITGYIDYTLTRFAWHDGKVDARSVSTARSWFYNTEGESYSACEFDVDAAEFAKSWAAARFIVGAREERIAPAPTDLEGGERIIGPGSHSSRRYIRVVGGAGDTLLFSDRLGWRTNAEHLPPWAQIRDEATLKVFKRLVPAKDASRACAPAPWSPLLAREIRRVTVAPRLEYRAEHGLLMEVCLRVVGEFGDAQALQGIEAWAARLAMVKEDDYALDTLRRETETARIKLGLTLHWDSAAALDLIGGLRARSDLDRWARRRFRENDLGAFFDAINDDPAHGRVIDDYDLFETLDAMRERPAPETLDALRRLFDRIDVDVRVAAARAVLAIDARDAAAVRVLREVIADRNVPVKSPGRWARGDALREAEFRGVLGPKELRTLLSDARPEHGLFVRALLDALKRTPEPATDDEARVAWRRVVDGPIEVWPELAVVALLDLHDAASRDRISRALEDLERHQSDRGARVPTAEVVRLSRRFFCEMAEPPTAK